MEELRKYIPIYLRICRSIALYLSFSLLFGLCSLCAGRQKALGTVLLPLIFHSTARVFGETDRHLRDLALAYRESHDVHHRVPREILALILRDNMLLLELAILLLFPTLLPLELGLTLPTSLLFGASALPRALQKLILLLILLPLFFGGWLFARYLAFLWWAYEEGQDRPEYYLAPLFLKLLGILGIYGIGSFAAIFFIPVFQSIYYISEALAALRWWLPVAVVALPIAALFTFRFSRACRIRRKFLRELAFTCHAVGATISEIKRPYRSLLRLGDEVNFTVWHGEKTYHCKLFSALRRHTPLYFSERGVVQCLHSFRFRRVEYFRYTTQFDFSFEGEGQKLLIVNPVPKEIFAGDTAFFRLIDTGEHVGDYTVFTASGLLGAISRDVVDR